MEESRYDVDAMGGNFEIHDLKKHARRQDAAAKPRNPLAAVEREILEEIASQSGRYGDRLDTLLRDMDVLRQALEPVIARLQLDDVPDGDAHQALNANIARYNQLRAQAQRVQHYLIIHREAMGFWNHDDVFRFYPIPSALVPRSSPHNPERPELR